MTWLSARRPRRAARVADRAPWDWDADSCSCGKLAGGCSTHPRGRPSQRPPAGDSRVWAYGAGRGAGKTRRGEHGSGIESTSWFRRDLKLRITWHTRQEEIGDRWFLHPPPSALLPLHVPAPTESALTLWEQRGILRRSGSPCLRRILRFGLHPHESRKTSQTVDRRIPFVNKCSSRFDRARHGRGVSLSTRPPASRGGIQLAAQRLSATASPARERAFFLLRLLENTGRRAGHLTSRAARPEVRGHRAKPIPHHPAIDTSGAPSGPIGQISGR